MKISIKTLTALGLLLAATASQAAPVPGTGGGYYGSAWFNSNQGIVVGAYSTWYECNQYLQAAIDYRVSNWGWTVTELNPCGYRPPFGTGVGVVGPDLGGITIDSDGPGSSYDEVIRILERVELVRFQFRADEFEAALSRIQSGR